MMSLEKVRFLKRAATYACICAIVVGLPPFLYVMIRGLNAVAPPLLLLSELLMGGVPIGGGVLMLMYGPREQDEFGVAPLGVIFVFAGIGWELMSLGLMNDVLGGVLGLMGLVCAIWIGWLRLVG